MQLTRRHLNRATLARQMLLQREPIEVVDAVRRIVAIQAQEPASPYVALWNRVEQLDPAEVDAAFADRSLVKASLMRITLHAVSADDYAAFHQAMVTNLRASRLNDRRYTSQGLEVADADEMLGPLLSFASQARTSQEMEAFVERRGGSPAKWLWWALKTFAPLAHAVTGPPWSFGNRPSYRAAPDGERPSLQEGVQRLLLRYLEGFGPATPQDFGQFALQRQPAIREALAALGDEVVELAGPDGTTLYDAAGGVLPDADAPAPPRLLAMWDSILLAYADRSRIIPAAYRSEIIRRNGDTLPAVLVDGYVAGVWRPAEGGGIEISVFHPLSAESWEALEAEALAMLEFLGGRDPAVYSRYRRWWDKLDSAEVRVLT